MKWLHKRWGSAPDVPATSVSFRQEPNGVPALRAGGPVRRHGAVRFFPPHFEGRARAWLAD
jgi:hypothetical protein